MKINKILAAGVAATLAVSALSAVASAEVKSIEFPMDYTMSGVSWNGTKIQWLDDNNYIGGPGYGAADTARALLVAEEAGTALKKVFAADLASLNGTDDNLKILGTAGTKPVIAVQNAGGTLAEGTDAIGLVKNGTTLPTSLANYETKVKTLIDQIVAAAPKVHAAGAKPENEYTAEKLLGDWKSLKANLEALRDQLYEIYVTVGALDETKYGGTTAAGFVKDEIDLIDATIKEMSAQMRAAEDALIGAPLLDDKERGGIWLNDTKAFELFKEDGVTSLGKYAKITGAKLKVTGTKRGSNANESYTWDFVPAYTKYGADHLGDDTKKDDKYTYRSGLYLVFGPRYVNRPGYVNLNVLGAITGVELDIDFDLYDSATNKSYFYTEAEYNKYKEILARQLWQTTDIRYFEQFDIELDVSDVYSPLTAAGDLATYKDPYWAVSHWVDDYNYTALPDHTTNLYKMYRALYNSVLTEKKTDNSSSKVTKYAFVEKTQTTGATIERKDVKVMSKTHSVNSNNQAGGTDGNQTYYDSGLGTNPNQFGGLASQVADFFNKQNNGQIIMHFVDPAKVTLWTSNGVPSTEVGLRTALAQTAFALFFNYEESTGSIQTIGTVDKDALTVTFDMEDVLDDFGGLTKANLHDIFYGCNNGLAYGDPYYNTGFAVDKVTLCYDDAPAAVDANTDDDAAADDDAAVVVADDDDDDDVVADDDDDDIAADDDIIEDDDDDDDDSGEIIADDDDDDDDVNNDVDYVDADDDANPGTGVGLAVIPAIVAGAALVVSKKRK